MIQTQGQDRNSILRCHLVCRALRTAARRNANTSLPCNGGCRRGILGLGLSPLPSTVHLPAPLTARFHPPGSLEMRCAVLSPPHWFNGIIRFTPIKSRAFLKKAGSGTFAHPFASSTRRSTGLAAYTAYGTAVSIAPAVSQKGRPRVLRGRPFLSYLRVSPVSSFPRRQAPAFGSDEFRAHGGARRVLPCRHSGRAQNDRRPSARGPAFPAPAR